MVEAPTSREKALEKARLARQRTETLEKAKLRKREDVLAKAKSKKTTAPSREVPSETTRFDGPIDTTERAMLSAGMSKNDVLRRRSLEERYNKSKIGLPLIQGDAPAFRKRVKDALDRAERFKDVRSRFASEDALRAWMEKNISEKMDETDRLEWNDAVNAVWNGDSDLSFYAKSLLHQIRMQKIPASFDPYRVLDKSVTATPSTTLEGEDKTEKVATDLGEALKTDAHKKIEDFTKRKTELSAEQQKSLLDLMKAIYDNEKDTSATEKLERDFTSEVAFSAIQFINILRTEVVQSLQKTLGKLSESIEGLSKQNTSLEDRLKALEARLSTPVQQTPLSQQQPGVPHIPQPYGPMPGHPGQINYNYNYPPQQPPVQGAQWVGNGWFMPSQPSQQPTAPTATTASIERTVAQQKTTEGIVEQSKKDTNMELTENTAVPQAPANIHIDAIRAQGLSKFQLSQAQYNRYSTVWGRFKGWFGDYISASFGAGMTSALVTKTGLLSAVGLGTLSAPALLAVALGAGVVGGAVGAYLRRRERTARLQSSAIRSVERRANQNVWRVGADTTDVHKALDKSLASKRRKEMMLNLAVGLGAGYANFAVHHGGDWKLESVLGEKWWSVIAEKFNGTLSVSAPADVHVQCLPELPSLQFIPPSTPDVSVPAPYLMNPETPPVAPPSVEVPIVPEGPPVGPTIPEVPSAPEGPPAVQDIAPSVEAVSQKIEFIQPATRGGVWTAAENIWKQIGITPDSGRVGRVDILTFLTDLVEDYTQDGSVPGTRPTSYFRSLGEGLLSAMTGQEQVTQVTIRNPIDMAVLFNKEDIVKDMARRITDNITSDTVRAQALQALNTVIRAVRAG